MTTFPTIGIPVPFLCPWLNLRPIKNRASVLPRYTSCGPEVIQVICFFSVFLSLIYRYFKLMRQTVNVNLHFRSQNSSTHPRKNISSGFHTLLHSPESRYLRLWSPLTGLTINSHRIERQLIYTSTIQNPNKSPNNTLYIHPSFPSPNLNK